MAESTEIAIPQAQWRQELNYRMRALLEAPPFEPEPEPNSNNRHQIVIPIDEDDVVEGNLMEAQLYNSAKQGGGHDFLYVLQRVSRSNKVRINRLLKTVSLAGDTVLHVAASNGNAVLVDLIITHFPSLLNEVNLIGDTAVHVAAKAGKAMVLRGINSKRKVFLNSGSLIICGLTNTQVEWKDDLLKVKNKQGNTPLHEALIYRPEKSAVELGDRPEKSAVELEDRPENLAVELLKEDYSVSVVPNVEGKSAFYLAVEAGYMECLRLMMEYAEHEGIDLRDVGKSPIHAAILGQKPDALHIMRRKQPGSINLRDDERRTPLHFAALMGYEDEVRYLIMLNNRNVIKRDKDGQLPIHLASMNGHIHVFTHLLQEHYNPVHELLNKKGQNILHVAAESGKYDVVKYILKFQELNQLINQKDDDGNTPLHLATMKSHPKIVSTLAWDDRVDVRLTNNKDLTALAVAWCNMDEMHTFRQWLTWLSLKASRSSLFNAKMQLPNTNESPPSEDPNQPSGNNDKQDSKDKVNTLLLVSTLIVTITFGACFTLPGGNNDSEPNKGFATMIKYRMFQVFVLCDTIALFTSLVVAAALIFTQVEITMTQTVLKLASPLLEFALFNMSLAFMSGVIVAVNNLKWLSSAILITVTLFMSVITLLLIPISLPFRPGNRVFQYIITFFIFKVT